jgi:hypothetical protein
VAGDGTDSNVSMRQLRIGHISCATAAVWVETNADQGPIYKMMMDERNRATKSDDSGPQRVYILQKDLSKMTPDSSLTSVLSLNPAPSTLCLDVFFAQGYMMNL